MRVKYTSWCPVIGSCGLLSSVNKGLHDDEVVEWVGDGTKSKELIRLNWIAVEMRLTGNKKVGLVVQVEA